MRRNAETYLLLSASIYDSAHSQPTPRTELFQLILLAQSMIGRVDADALKAPLHIIVEAIERLPLADRPNRTLLLDLASKLPTECESHAIRLRAFAA